MILQMCGAGWLEVWRFCSNFAFQNAVAVLPTAALSDADEVTLLNKIYLIAAATVAALPAYSAISIAEHDTSLGVHADSLEYVMLDDVDVVAVKSGSNFRALPLTGSIVSGTRAEKLIVNDVKGISGVVPNFYIPDYGSRITSSIYVRGIGARMDQPAVGLTVDNVGILNKDAYDIDLADISSMEMLKGPQSSMFGRNTMTGMISVRTLTPWEFQGWRGSVSEGLHSLFRFSLGWYKKFTPTAAMSVSGNFFRYGGEFINECNGKTTDKEVSGGVRIKNYWNPSANIRLSNVAYASFLRQGGYAYESVATGKIAYNDTCFYRRFLFTDGLTADIRLPGSLSLTSVTTVQYLDDRMTLDQDFLPESYFTLSQKKEETTLTEELMLRGRAAEGNYHWLVGAYGFYNRLGMQAPVVFKDQGISELIEHYRNAANPYYPIAWDSREMTLGSDFKLPSGGFALYHESRYDLGRWHFMAALRYDYERISMSYDSRCESGYTIYQNPSGQLPMPEGVAVYNHVPVDLKVAGRLVNHYSMFSPKIGATWDLPEVGGGLLTGNVYASISKGFKAGGFNTQMFSDVLQQKLMEFMGLSAQYDIADIVSYKPEKIWNYEVGSHLDLLNGNLTADVSLFYIDCRDQQLTVFPPGQTTGRMMTNAGRTRSFGGELTLNYNPIPQLDLLASYGYTNARFVDFNDGLEDYRGKRLPYAPANTLFAQATYIQSCSTRLPYYLEFSVNFNGAGNIYWNESNTLRQNFYGLLGTSIAYRAPRWSVEVWGKNLTQTKYCTFYFKSMGNEFLQRGQKMMLGFTVRAKF